MRGANEIIGLINYIALTIKSGVVGLHTEYNYSLNDDVWIFEPELWPEYSKNPSNLQLLDSVQSMQQKNPSICFHVQRLRELIFNLRIYLFVYIL